MEHSERRAEVTQQVAATCCAVETSSCQHLGQRFFVLITRKLAGKSWGAGVGPPRRLALADGRRTWVGNSRNRKQTCGRATTTSCKQAAVNGYKHKKARSSCQKQKQQNSISTKRKVNDGRQRQQKAGQAKPRQGQKRDQEVVNGSAKTKETPPGLSSALLRYARLRMVVREQTDWQAKRACRPKIHRSRKCCPAACLPAKC